jgi:hypothetical protein
LLEFRITLPPASARVRQAIVEMGERSTVHYGIALFRERASRATADGETVELVGRQGALLTTVQDTR